MDSINDVGDAFGQAPTNVDGGILFERSLVGFFKLHAALAREPDVVWRWIDMPERIGKPDTSIDRVARGHDTGEYTAIQHKV